MWNDRPFPWVLRRGETEDALPFRFVDDGAPVSLAGSVLHLFVEWGGAVRLHLVSGVDAGIQILDQSPSAPTLGMAQGEFTLEQKDAMPREGITFAWWREVGEEMIPEFSGQIVFENLPDAE